MSLRLNFAKAKLCFRISIPSHQNKKHPSGWFRYRQAHACGKNSFLPPRSDTSARLVVSLAQRPKNSHLGSFCLSYRHRHGLSNLNSFPPKQKAHLSVCFVLAEKERFELSNPFTGYTISNRARSTSYATSPCLSLTELFYHNDL